jgi:hypothetical protein
MEKTLCRNPVAEKAPTRIDRWKFELVRSALLELVPRDAAGVAFRDLAGRIRSRLSAEELARLGSVGWYVTTVKLELEVRGELERIAGINPQRLRRPG